MAGEAGGDAGAEVGWKEQEQEEEGEHMMRCSGMTYHGSGYDYNLHAQRQHDSRLSHRAKRVSLPHAH